MVLVQAGFQLGIVAQFLEDFGLLDSLADSPDIPDNAIAQHHAPDPVIILGVGHSVHLQVDLDFLLGEVLSQDIFNFLHEVFAFVGQLIRLYVVSDHYLLGRRELGEVDGDDLLPGFHIEDDIAEALGVVALLDVRNSQLDPHALHQRYQPQLQTLLAGGLGDIGSPFDLHILGVAKRREDGHKALQHESTAGGRVRTDMGGLAEVGEDVDLLVPHFRDPLRECREDRPQLVVNARLGPVLPDGVHLEAFVQDGGESQGGADHLAAALVQAAIDFDVLFVHDIPILQSQQKNKQYKRAFPHHWTCMLTNLAMALTNSSPESMKSMAFSTTWWWSRRGARLPRSSILLSKQLYSLYWMEMLQCYYSIASFSCPTRTALSCWLIGFFCQLFDD